jgi:succinyl-diaminopimelate desuccinylase
MAPVTLNLEADVVELTRQICDIESVSGNETELADAIQAALSAYAHLEVLRDGDAVVARTNLGRASRVVIAGHIDTVPVADNLPVKFLPMEREQVLWGRGTVDMKAGVAVQLKLAATVAEPNTDVTWIFYDHEEVEASKNGLGRLARNHPELLNAALPSSASQPALRSRAAATAPCELKSRLMASRHTRQGHGWVRTRFTPPPRF